MRTLFKRLGTGFSLLLNLALAGFLVAMLVVLACRLDYSLTFPGRPQDISQRAKMILADLTGTVRCVVIVPHNNAFYENVRQLLFNMKAAAKNADLQLEFPDPHTDISRASDAVTRAGATGWCLIFEKDDRTEVIPFESLLDRTEIDNDSLLPGSVVSTRFRGEQQCLTAISRLARPFSPVVYALTGHGERDFTNYDRIEGYSDLAREIRREGCQLLPLSLPDMEAIPGNCSLLVVAGPRRAPLPAEADAILAYLSRGGRLLFLIDRQDRIPNGWEGIAARLGIRFANLTAIAEGTLGGFNMTIDKFSDHPVCHDLGRSAVTFSSPQVLDIDPELAHHHRLRTDIVAQAPRRAWGETSPDVIPRRYDPGIDRIGILPLAVAVETDGSDDLGLDLMRAFVIGDSNIGANAFLGGGGAANRDILLNAIDWLTDNGSPSASSTPSEGNALQLNISKSRQIRFWVGGVFLWPLSICLLGGLIALVRRF